jgi:hypothetical protein
MNYLVKDKQLPIHYDPGKGAWTYSIIIPNTKDLKGKWGVESMGDILTTTSLNAKILHPRKAMLNYYLSTVK